MTLDETMAELEAMGTEQNRSTYRRHGATGDLFGVSYANRGLLRKQIKQGQALAEGLWATRNEDAAIAAARASGPVDVDHGDSSCKTPDAASYLKKTRDRQRIRSRAGIPA